ncbi:MULTISPECIES: glucan 1,4-alpha-glucosidase [unclassified Halorubrum]|uniref:glucan 1,4-alpha-glucosidase n=1 Tax=unclassified Halorubrum TaxID=2642239 RepID=UPI0010F93C8C|nr:MULTISPECIES: glucan 1,4-alpha-glucosidase [unclassified Halorubrum]TKX44186.1 glucan 1,4-alpha-glucosidase [Halorubrum sp. ARQ200]TKX50906.1 glucan 1,4-alpha-glucosidase [Halorubrum sp. ASP121]
MQLRDALDDYKRHAGDGTRFPGERRTVSGRFSGGNGRLVHVGDDGELRDFGYPLTGRTGLVRSRIGLAVGDEVAWLDEAETSQRYVGDTALVETVHETPRATVTRHDLTLGDAHLTRASVEFADGDVDPADASLVVYARFAPDGRDDRVGQLRYDDAVEVYHADERDFLASATGFADLRGQLPATFPELLDDDPTELPRDRDGDRYEEERLSGEVIADVPFDDGVATVATLLTDRAETDREAARERLADLFADLDDVDALAEAAADALPSVPESAPARESVVADLRVLSLLSAPSGLRIAGPDFDPYYEHSGGYGYTWFRDDAEISGFLLGAADAVDLDLDDWHARSARMYVDTQRPDGSWPHRVWPRNGALAPGWANARIEDGPDVDYQADQTGSVVAYLARARATGVDVAGLDATLVAALAGLDRTLEPDGRPVVCQNAWEDSAGRFAHTAATFLEAYSELARHGEGLSVDALDDPDAVPGAASLPDDLAAHARDRAREVYDALDDLWVPERGCYAVRETLDGGIDDRLDSATLALAAAHRSFDALGAADGEGGAVDDERLDRLVSHVETVVDGLSHETDDIAGLIRYEGDGWRRADQLSEKVWTVSTAWGANACAELAALLAAHDDPRAAEMTARARDLLAHVSPGGSLCEPTTYLPEQFFDDGTPDSATPLGWPHAIRLATVALLDDELPQFADRAAADDD